MKRLCAFFCMLLLLAGNSLVQAQPGPQPRYHKVQPLETLYDLSRQYEVDVPSLKKWNKMGSSDYIEPGTSVIVGYTFKVDKSPDVHTQADPGVGSRSIHTSGESSRSIAPQTTSSSSHGPKTIYHTLKPGDNIYNLARRYRVSEEDLKKWNQITDVKNVRVGGHVIVGFEEEEKTTHSAASEQSRGLSISSEPPSERKPIDYEWIKEINHLDIIASKMPQIYAVIVGVSDYEYIPKLNYADDDAYRVFAFFKSIEGGLVPNNQLKVLVDENATREKILNALHQLYARAGENDHVILYFAGKATNGSFFPVDYNAYTPGISYREIKDIMDKSRAKGKVVLSDVTYSAAYGQASNRKASSEDLNLYYQEIASSLPRTFAVSYCSGQERSVEKEQVRQGMFTYYFLKGLEGAADENHDQVVTLEELTLYLKVETGRETRSQDIPRVSGGYKGNVVLTRVR